ncbi:hypothetical protein T01_4903 [Trichinella spiralis]|uniref:Uncharacterized protein n=1 Tax=Trichinella spiralis TaxID=6334 RepID=A0A0V1BJ11_TRISP|nr:hypothetical protein T01_4903 [Trichinella spiralis]
MRSVVSIGVKNGRHLIEIYHFDICLHCRMFIGIGQNDGAFFADALLLNLTLKCVKQLFPIFYHFEQTYATSFMLLN